MRPVSDGAKLYPGGLRSLAEMATTVPYDLKHEYALPAVYTEPRWYAAYACANHEKRVAQQLGRRCVEFFLPLHEALRLWKDRRVRLQLPLFPGYIFVRIALRDRMRVLEIPSVVHLVSFNGLPTALPEEEIEAIRSALNQRLRIQPHPHQAVGSRVRIKGGPLQGFEGILLRRKGNCRIVLTIDLIMRSVVVDVDLSDVEPIQPCSMSVRDFA